MKPVLFDVEEVVEDPDYRLERALTDARLVPIEIVDYCTIYLGVSLSDR